MLNKKVKTEHGTGVVIGFDCPESTFERAKRVIVKISENTGKRFLKSLYPNSELCYNLNEIEFIK